MWIDGRTVMSLVMLAIFAAMVAVASTYPEETRLLPLVIGIPGIVLCLVQVVIDGIAAKRMRPGTALSPSPRVIREVVLLGWFLGFLLMVLLFGFLAAAPVMIFAFLYVDQREPLRLAAIMSAAGFAVLYLVFETLLELILFRGLVTEWLTG
jgi:hypothetical protein